MLLGIMFASASNASPLQTLLSSNIKADEQVILFPTHAYYSQIDKQWVVPIHGWIHELENQSGWRAATLTGLAKALGLDADISNNALFKQRARMFLVDNQRNKALKVEVAGQTVNTTLSLANGHFTAKVLLEPTKTIKTLNTSLAMPANDPRKFNGKVFFPTLDGVSVISDIDDTVKISQVLNKKKLLENTFYKPFKIVPGMEKVYTTWQEKGASFHYVSSSPWQLYPVMQTFFTKSGLPEGSFHLKTFRIKDESFLDLFASPMESKVPTIAGIINKYPKQTFILVGDSGEKDPEVYAEIFKRHASQIKHIFIRNVSEQSQSDNRFQRAFRDIDQKYWTVFTNPQTLLKNPMLFSQ